MLLLNWPARILVAIGCGCLMTVGIQLVDAESYQLAATHTLDRELSTAAPAPAAVENNAPTPDALTPAGEDAPDAPPSAPAPVAEHGLVGRLEIPRLNLSAIVIEGDDEHTLARGVGHVPGTAMPWQPGNTVMAGHRDTFFRPLKDLRDGDQIRMITPGGTFEYEVTGAEIVSPDDVAVLAPTPARALTLITCYPFVYVGHAPQRFVIHAHALAMR